MLKTQFRRCKLCQIVRKRQTVYSAASDNDTVIDSAGDCLSHTVHDMSVDSTYPCPSQNPTLNGCNLTPPALTQTSEQEYSDTWRSVTCGRQRSTLAALTKAFCEGPSRMLSRGQQNMSRHLYHTPTIFRKISGEWKSGLQCCGKQYETRAGYHPAWVQLFRGISFQRT